MQALQIIDLSSAGKLVWWMAWKASLHLLTVPIPLSACIILLLFYSE